MQEKNWEDAAESAPRKGTDRLLPRGGLQLDDGKCRVPDCRVGAVYHRLFRERPTTLK